MAWDRPSKQAVAAASAELAAAEIDAHNAQHLRNEIEQHLLAATHEIDTAHGLLDDLSLYLPKVGA